MIPAGQKCCRTLLGYGCRTFHCKNAAKVERDGRFYCGVHDPEKDKARRAARDAKWIRDTKIRECQSKLSNVRNQIADSVIEYVQDSNLKFLRQEAKALKAELDALLEGVIE